MSADVTRLSLLVRVRDPRDQSAWDQFHKQYRELILRYGRGRGLQDADAEDVLQNVMSGLARSMRNFEFQPGKGKFRAYLGQIVRNAISRHVARRPSGQQAFDTTVEATTPASDTGEDALWEQEWTNHHYRLAMQTIRATFDPRSVEIFDRLLRGETVEQLAAAYQSTPDAVNKVKQRMRKRIEELIAEQIRDEDAVA